MARPAQLGKVTIKGVQYWRTRVGGKPVYFGKVKEVKREEADKAFLAHRQKVLAKPDGMATEIAVSALVDQYLDWSKVNHSESNYANKRSALKRWCSHKVSNTGLAGAGKRIGNLPALHISAAHLDDFINARRDQGATAGKGSVRKKGQAKATRKVGPTALAADMQHVKACFNWARVGDRCVPKDFRPFADVPRIKIPKRPKLESELPTPEEYAQLLAFADYDLEPLYYGKGKTRRRTPEECRQGDENPYRGFADLLKCYYAIGPRTGEFAAIRLEDVSIRKSQVTLGKHKTANSTGRPRTLTLNAEALEIFKRQMTGKSSKDHVFLNHVQKPWTTDTLVKRFSKVRKLAGVRDEITIYSFRHLWISDLMETDIPLGTIADMAGTSVKQIEATYGHIRTTAKAAAQAVLDEHRQKRAG